MVPSRRPVPAVFYSEVDMIQTSEDGSFQSDNWSGVDGGNGFRFDAKTKILHAHNVTFSDEVKAALLASVKSEGIGGA